MEQLAKPDWLILVGDVDFVDLTRHIFILQASTYKRK
jgi:hypothetical protein